MSPKESFTNEQRLLQCQLFVNRGNWEWDISSGDLYWSDIIAPMFGLDINPDKIKL